MYIHVGIKLLLLLLLLLLLYRTICITLHSHIYTSNRSYIPQWYTEYIHTYIHTHTHTYIHTYIHTIFWMAPSLGNLVQSNLDFVYSMDCNWMTDWQAWKQIHAPTSNVDLQYLILWKSVQCVPRRDVWFDG
jgi:Cft2 family RNA processing exonuclease